MIARERGLLLRDLYKKTKTARAGLALFLAAGECGREDDGFCAGVIY